MTDEEINKAVAEICGICHSDKHGLLYKTNTGWVRDCPDYCGDLNAIAEAEKATFGSSDIWKEFAINLIDTIKCESMSELDIICCVIQATARQHAETFLKTVKEWEEAK